MAIYKIVLDESPPKHDCPPSRDNPVGAAMAGVVMPGVALLRETTPVEPGAAVGNFAIHMAYVEYVGNPNHHDFSKKYRNTPPICIAIRLEFLMQYFGCP